MKLTITRNSATRGFIFSTEGHVDKKAFVDAINDHLYKTFGGPWIDPRLVEIVHTHRSSWPDLPDDPTLAPLPAVPKIPETRLTSEVVLDE